MFSSTIWPLTGCLANKSMLDTWLLPCEKSQVITSRSSTANLAQETRRGARKHTWV